MRNFNSISIEFIINANFICDKKHNLMTYSHLFEIPNGIKNTVNQLKSNPLVRL
jgi:hypothetical protein